MNRTIKKYPIINETLETVILDNGLTLYLINKKGFKAYYASLGVKYGSNNNSFVPYGESEMITMPLGIAHFLEHQLFEKEDNDASLIFNKYGIESNAYTSFLETNYYISGTNNLEIGIELLFDFVQNGYFSDEHVQKEKNVIASEIKMYLDNPGSRIYDGICNNLFKYDNLKYDIAGTTESIEEINASMLEKAYKTFYQPNNMYFCLVGDFDNDKIIELINNNQKKNNSSTIEIKTSYPNEPTEINKKYSEIEMDIAYPKVAIGIKLPGFTKNNPLVQNMFKMILDSKFGYSSKNYQLLLDKELTNGGFTYSTTITPYSSFIKFQCDTDKVEEFIEFMKTEILSINKDSITEERIERCKKNIIGQALKQANSISSIAVTFMDYIFAGANFFDFLSEFENLQYEDFMELFNYFKEENMSIFVIKKAKS